MSYELNEVYDSICESVKCEIKGNKIVELKGLPRKKYNPFDFNGSNGRSRLWFEFASIDENNAEDIKGFIDRFGFLGLEQYYQADNSIQTTRPEYTLSITKEELDKKKMESLYARTKLAEALRTRQQENETVRHSFEEELLKENIEDIQYEIKRMKLIISLWQATEERNFHEIERLMENYWILNSNYSHPSLENIDQAIYLARIIICKEINKELAQIIQLMGVSFSSNTFDFTVKYRAPNLLSSIYALLYKDIVNNLKVKWCKNPTCTKIFAIYGNDNRKEFCDEKCARATASREYRKRKQKERRDKDGDN